MSMSHLRCSSNRHSACRKTPSRHRWVILLPIPKGFLLLHDCISFSFSFYCRWTPVTLRSVKMDWKAPGSKCREPTRCNRRRQTHPRSVPSGTCREISKTLNTWLPLWPEGGKMLMFSVRSRDPTDDNTILVFTASATWPTWRWCMPARNEAGWTKSRW